MIEQLRQWAEELKNEALSKSGDYWSGRYVVAVSMLEKIDELQPVKPDSVEGYLDNAKLVFVDDAEQGNVEVIGAIFRSDALAALQALVSDKDAEKEWMAKGFREQDKIWNELVSNLTAENERLKECNPILELRKMLMDMMHKNPHITPYDVVKMIDKIYPSNHIPEPPKQ